MRLSRLWVAIFMLRRAWAVVLEGWKVRPPTKADLTAVEANQLHHATQTIGVPAVSLCRKGFPQAVIQDPSKHKFGAGLVRLTCPHLCEAIDDWEGQDAVRALSRELLVERPSEGPRALARVNARHAATRQSLVGPEAEAAAVARIGEAAVAHAMKSGIAGITPTKLNDIKCLHAQVADELLSGDNDIGKQILARLQSDRGVDPAGSAVCHEQCAGCQGGWSYTPVKNKQKLWKTKERRKEHIERRRQGFKTPLGPPL